MNSVEMIPDNRARQLFQPVVSVAESTLRKEGALGPFSFYLDREGNLKRAVVEMPLLTSDWRTRNRLLLEHLRRLAGYGELHGVATAVHETLHPPSPEGYREAVVVHMEMHDGYQSEAVVPYRVQGGHLMGLVPRRVVFGQIQVNNTARAIFQSA